ncbi:Gfo/Idh/MocA family protein [Nocardiopsis ansamitocini]|uniref:Oxidoreductase n=1 Tax=Nocardiopsis ansamitocini TaxID=1670832 RepID=A0A9W6PAZ2_9ACTN|nr:Gfo/Idh/MocA family oxidoreductase [Nocardiopsis ansamitocini]GLU50351.1 oxidoreductase [Nocardiopsis ansamitocini]
MNLPPAQADPGAPIRVALVGLGWAATSIWLPRLRRHPGFAIVAAVDLDPTAREAFARAAPGVPILADVGGLAPGQVDLAVVAVPNHAHCAVAVQLLRRGLPVFVEKPVCLDIEQADRLAAAERSGGAALLAGSAARLRGDVRALHDVLPSLGPIRHLDVAWVRARGVPDSGGWFTHRQLAGGGALLDLGWHLLDTALALLGPVSFAQVVGATSADFVNAHSRRAVWRGEGTASTSPTSAGDVEDTARGFLTTDEGTSIALRASWASHEAHDTTLLRAEGSRATATLSCTFGFSPNRSGRSSLTLTRDGHTVHLPLPDDPVGAEYDRQLDLIPALLADPATHGDALDDARQIIAVIDGIYASARAAQIRPVAAAR